MAVLLPDLAAAKLVKGKCYWGQCPGGGACLVWPWDIRFAPQFSAANTPDQLYFAAVASRAIAVDGTAVVLNGQTVKSYPVADEELLATVGRVLQDRGLYDGKTERLHLFRTDALNLRHGDCGSFDLILNEGKGGVGLLPGLVFTGEDLKAPDFPDNLEHLVDDLNTNPLPPRACQHQLR
jgi:hypothetical protein